MYIVTAKEMYDIDHYTMQEIGIDGKLLMENAGRAICGKMKAIIRKKTELSCLLVLVIMAETALLSQERF